MNCCINAGELKNKSMFNVIFLHINSLLKVYVNLYDLHWEKKLYLVARTEDEVRLQVMYLSNCTVYFEKLLYSLSFFPFYFHNSSS